jgi:hypothetical protein
MSQPLFARSALGRLLAERVTRPLSPSQGRQPHSDGPATAAAEDPFAQLRRYGDDRNRPAGAARPDQLMAGTVSVPITRSRSA